MTREQAVRLAHRLYRKHQNDEYTVKIYRDGTDYRVFEFSDPRSWVEGAGVCVGVLMAPRVYAGDRGRHHMTLAEVRAQIAAAEADAAQRQAWADAVGAHGTRATASGVDRP